MINNRIAYKHETTYNGPFVITQCWNNGTITLQCGPVQIIHNIRYIKPYTSNTNVEDITTKNRYDYVNI